MSEEAFKIVFLVPTGKSEITVNDSLSKAFETARNSGLAVDWIEEEKVENILRVKSAALPDIIVSDVLDHSQTYSQLRLMCENSLVTLLGPQCLLTCLTNNLPIPDTPYPVITGAMRGCTVTSSGLSAETREEMRKVVERMWGEWSDSLHEGVTHLVSVTVLSPKYRAALSAGIPVMSPAWLEEVWRLSSTDPAVTVVDKRLVGGYKCPVMSGVRLCVTQLNRHDRQIIQTKVESEGGEYTGDLDHTTNVLVAAKQAGDKWTAARRWGLTIVTSQWIVDSVERGECLDPDNYRVSSEEETRDTVNINTSRFSSNKLFHSVINNSISNNSSLNNSSLNDSTLTSKCPVAEELDLKQVKKSGTFLDGCKIHVVGFSREDEAHVYKVLKYAGALKMCQMMESVSHVVFNDKLHDATELKRELEEKDLAPLIFPVSWIVESMKIGRPMSGDEFTQTTNDEAEAMIEDTSNYVEDDSVNKLHFEQSLLEQYK